MKILSIETSCDETSVAILNCDEENESIQILSNIVSSQIPIHAKWGGVVPNLAAREHLKNTLPVLKQSLEKAQVTLKSIDLIATTQGPGLIPALLIGTNAAKALAYTSKIPLLGIHHIEGHLYANILNSNLTKMQFPLIALVVSGGHTQIILMKENLNYEILGQTQDDAVGEAFDKVSKMLGLGYPGGPVVSTLADDFMAIKKTITDTSLLENLEAIKFPRPMLTSNNLNFSFSGLKTAVLYFYQKIEKEGLDQKTLDLYKMAICAAFQEAAVDVLVKKTSRAISKHTPKTVILAGGVAANKHLQKTLSSAVDSIDNNIAFLNPAIDFCGDNAAMIGAAAFVRYRKLKSLNLLDSLDNEWGDLEANSSLKLQNI